jgi:hypothetical protein
VKTIVLSGKLAAGRATFIDDEDWPLVAGYRWRVYEVARRPGRKPGGPYAQTWIRRDDGRLTSLLMHKLITGWPMTDHINHDGLDNRRANLRPATAAQNQQNQRSHSGTSSMYKGVTWDRQHSSWRASIHVNRRNCFLGLFASEPAAAVAYNAAALDAFGEYACLNVIEAAA